VRKNGSGCDHQPSENLLQQLNDAGLGEVDYIFCLNDTDGHLNGMAEAIKPQGAICSIVENEKDLDLNVLKSKSVTFAWEFMYTRSMFETDDMIKQHHLLNKVSELVDNGTFQTTLTKTIKPMNAEQLRKAHKELESGKMIGKLVVENEE
jgi:NADPH:quinone reductase-like Zn-dependent oxidoreductase